MRLRSNTLTEQDLRQALAKVSPDLDIEFRSIGRGHNTTSSYDVTLVALPGKDHNGKNRRRKNPGNGSNNETRLAATYDEYGEWFAHLFAADNDLIVDKTYNGLLDFQTKTHFKYPED